MTEWAVRFVPTGRRAGTTADEFWQFARFDVPRRGEAPGIVDLIPSRRDPAAGNDACYRFETLFVLVKGRSAAWPTVQDMRRMRAVQRRYRARAVVLEAWKTGAEPTVYLLVSVSADRERAWRDVQASAVFGATTMLKPL